MNAPSDWDLQNGVYIQRVKIDGFWNILTFGTLFDLIHRLQSDHKFATEEGTSFEDETILVFIESEVQPFVINKVRAERPIDGFLKWDLVVGSQSIATYHLPVE
jgi:hypothetical protein